MLNSISFGSLGLLLLLTAPVAADIGPARPQCQTAGASCRTRGGQRGACVAVESDLGPPLQCRVVAPPPTPPTIPPADPPEDTVEDPVPDPPADTVEEPAADPPADTVEEPVVNPPADVPPGPEPEEPQDDDSFFSCAAPGPGSGVTPLGSLAFVALAWAAFFLRRRRNG